MLNYGTGNYQISQSDTRRRPRLTIRNGAPMISSSYEWFDLSPTLVTTNPYTVVMVGRRGNIDATTHGFIGSNSFDNTASVFSGGGGDARNLIFLRGGSGQQLNYRTVFSPGDYSVRTAVIVKTEFSSTAYYTGNPTMINDLQVGWNQSWTRMAYGFFYGGDFGDIAYFDRALSSSEVSDVMSYLESIYPL